MPHTQEENAPWYFILLVTADSCYGGKDLSSVTIML